MMNFKKGRGSNQPNAELNEGSIDTMEKDPPEAEEVKPENAEGEGE